MDSGYLEIIYGPMFSGKTCKLHARLSEFSDVGLKTLYLNHSSDSRSTQMYSTNVKGSCGSFISGSITQIKTPTLKETLSQIGDYQVIGIDEAQFFTDLLEMVKLFLGKNKIIIVSGLNGTFDLDEFGQILKLIPLADKSIHLSAHCKACIIDCYLKKIQPIVKVAPFTLRLSNRKDEKSVGGADSYAAVCRFHHDYFQNVCEKERIEFFAQKME